MRAPRSRVNPGGTWLISASTAPGRRCGIAASSSRSTAEVSLPLAASVGTSRETITSGHSARAAGSVAKRIRCPRRCPDGTAPGSRCALPSPLALQAGRRRGVDGAREPEIVVARGLPRGDELLEMAEIARPGPVGARDDVARLLGHAARELAPSHHELAAAPLGEPVHLEGSAVADHFDAPPVPPGQEAALDDHRAIDGGEDAVVRTLQL